MWHRKAFKCRLCELKLLILTHMLEFFTYPSTMPAAHNKKPIWAKHEQNEAHFIICAHKPQILLNRLLRGRRRRGWSTALKLSILVSIFVSCVCGVHLYNRDILDRFGNIYVYFCGKDDGDGDDVMRKKSCSMKY